MKSLLKKLSNQPFPVILNKATATIERKLNRGKLFSVPQIIDLITSHRCNLHCIGCVPYTYEGPADLTLELFEKVLDQTNPVTTLYSFCSLGEPFMNKNIHTMLEKGKRRGARFSIVTNGTLVNKERADFLVECGNVLYLTFSVDGARAQTCEKLRRGLSFDKLVAAIDHAANAKRSLHATNPFLSFNFTAYRENIEELPELVRFAFDHGVEAINVNYATIEADANPRNSLYYAPELQKKCFQKARTLAQDLKIALTLPQDIDNNDFSRSCREPFSTLIIDTDGSVRLCYCCWHQVIGNVNDCTVKKVWNNHIYQNVRRTMKSVTPFYRYCAYCGRMQGYSKWEAHMGKNEENKECFLFNNKDRLP